jgi:hypothetical protein
VKRFVVKGIRGRVVRCAADVAACFVLVAMSIQMSAPQVAAKAPIAQAPRPSDASLNPKAPPTEVASKRTATSDTYDNHDGTLTAQISSGPINYIDPSTKTYQPIDTTLAPVSGGNGRVRASHMSAPVEVGSPDDSAGFLSMDTGAGVIRLSLAPGVKPGTSGSKPTTKGPQADVPGLMSNIDLRASVDTTGVHTYFILNSRPSTSSFSLLMDTGGLTPTLQSNGSVLLLDSKGNSVAEIPAPYATDSAIDPNVGSGNTTYGVAYSLRSQGKQTLLTVSVDPAWLAKATYPVYVDPSVVNVTGSSLVWNNSVSSSATTSVFSNMYNSPYHEVVEGYDSLQQWGAYLRFDVAGAAIPAAYVASASAVMLPYHQWVTSNAGTCVSLVTSSWSPTSLTWNNAPFHSDPYTPSLPTSGETSRHL